MRPQRTLNGVWLGAVNDRPSPPPPPWFRGTALFFLILHLKRLETVSMAQNLTPKGTQITPLHERIHNYKNCFYAEFKGKSDLTPIRRQPGDSTPGKVYMECTLAEMLAP